MTYPNNLVDKITNAVSALPFQGMLANGRGTRIIMDVLGKLGHSLGYKVQCNLSHYSDADDGEWLYDMMWCSESKRDGETLLTGMPMILEAELLRGPKHRDEIDGDFQKPIQARADVRVWISTSPSNARLHINNCKEQIQLFSGTTSGDQYVFAVFDWAAGKPLVERFVAP